MQRATVVISVGGTKLQIAVVEACAPVVLADSGRVEWSRDGRASIEGLLNTVVQRMPGLLSDAGLGVDAVGHLGIAWPGPVNDGRVEATFVAGCEDRPHLGELLRRALAPMLGSAAERLPVTVELDAYVRACGECVAGGAFSASGTGLLINHATGIAGCVVLAGRAQRTHPTQGPAYGQFGRFLLRDVESGRWHWSRTSDGSVPPHPPGQVRWTRWSGGQALAARAAAWCQAQGCLPADPVVRSALNTCNRADARDVAAERVVLDFVTQQWRDIPSGEVASFARVEACELGSAIDTLAEVLTGRPLDCVVLAGGVGETFAAPSPGQPDTWLDAVHNAAPHGPFCITRSRLGVRAELFGFCEQPSGLAAQPAGPLQ